MRHTANGVARWVFGSYAIRTNPQALRELPSKLPPRKAEADVQEDSSLAVSFPADVLFGRAISDQYPIALALPCDVPDFPGVERKLLLNAMCDKQWA